MAQSNTTITLDPDIKRELAGQKPEAVPWNVYFHILKESADPKRVQNMIEAYLKAEYEASVALARSRYETARKNPAALLSSDEARAEIGRLQAIASRKPKPTKAALSNKRSRARSSNP